MNGAIERLSEKWGVPGADSLEIDGVKLKVYQVSHSGNYFSLRSFDRSFLEPVLYEGSTEEVEHIYTEEFEFWDIWEATGTSFYFVKVGPKHTELTNKILSFLNSGPEVK